MSLQNSINQQFPINKSFFSKVESIRKIITTAKASRELIQDEELFRIVSKIVVEDMDLSLQLRFELYHKILEVFGKNWKQIDRIIINKSIAEIGVLLKAKYVEAKTEYGNCFSRNYHNILIKDWLYDFVQIEDPTLILKASKSAVRVFLDMNGIGKLNQIGKPFHTISKAIGLFVQLLKTSETVKLIRQIGLEYKLSVDGGDEFSILIYDPKFEIDVYSLMPEIKYSLLLEMENTNINNILEKNKLEQIFGQDVPRIHISSSFGYYSFWQLVNILSTEELKSKNEEEFLRLIILSWFDITYAEATRFKQEYKQMKIAENPRLYNYLFNK